MKLKITSISFALLLCSCASLISHFDQNSYQSAMSLKSQAMTLIGESGDPATQHQPEINDLKAKLAAQVAYEEGKGKPNRVSYTQWELLASPDKDLLGGFIKRWESGTPMTKPFVSEKSAQIGQAFDEILRLEAAKQQ